MAEEEGLKTTGEEIEINSKSILYFLNNWSAGWGAQFSYDGFMSSNASAALLQAALSSCCNPAVTARSDEFVKAKPRCPPLLQNKEVVCGLLHSFCCIVVTWTYGDKS